MNTRKRITLGLRGLVSVGLLVWIFTRPELARLGECWRGADVRWLAAGFGCAGGALALGAWRWQACLRAVGVEVGFGVLWRVSLTATAAGCVSFGAMASDVAKVVLLGRELPGRRAALVSSVALDHVSAVPCLVAMVVAGVAGHGALGELRWSAAWLACAGGAVVLTVLAALVVRWKFPRVSAAALQVLTGPAAWRGLLVAIWRSVPMWMAYCGIFYCAARAVGVVVPPVGFAGVVALADSVAALPVTLAGLGVREQAFRVLLERWYGVPAAASVALSLTGFALFLGWAACGALTILRPARVSPSPLLP